jgi:hypothetical protein
LTSQLLQACLAKIDSKQFTLFFATVHREKKDLEMRLKAAEDLLQANAISALHAARENQPRPPRSAPPLRSVDKAVGTEARFFSTDLDARGAVSSVDAASIRAIERARMVSAVLSRNAEDQDLLMMDGQDIIRMEE